MSERSTITARLAFNGIDRETVAVLRDAKSFVLAEMPAVLDGFYRHVEKFSETKMFFKSSEVMKHAKQMQRLEMIGHARHDRRIDALRLRKPALTMQRFGFTDGMRPEWQRTASLARSQHRHRRCVRISGPDAKISESSRPVIINLRDRPE